MKSQKLFLTLLCFFVLCGPAAWAGTIIKVKGSKALVKAQQWEYEKGDEVFIFNEFEDKVGSARVYKTKGRKVYIRLLSGELQRGFKVQKEDEEQESSNSGTAASGGHTIKGYAGFGSVNGIDSVPLVFGGDYQFAKGILLDDWQLHAGFLYWSTSVSFVSFSILEISGGLETNLAKFGKVDLNAGGRFGYANVTASVSSPFIGTVESSDGNLFFAPQVNAMYNFNEKLKFGGELRVPYYLHDSFDFFDIFYFLGSVSYTF